QCTGLFTWGINDGTEPIETRLCGNGNSFLFDQNYGRKPAFYGVTEAIAENASRCPAGGGGGTADTTPPAVPRGLIALPATKSVTVRWNANTEADLAGYDLGYRRAGATRWTVI